MGSFELVILILGVALLAILWTVIEWMPRYLKRRASNWKLGVGHEPELRGELVKTFVIVWLCRTVQLGLVGVVLLARPTGIGWIPIVAAFVLSLLVSFAADSTRRNLLA